MDTTIEDAVMDMTEFYLKTLFYSIPIPEIYIDKDMEEGVLGSFGLERGNEYLVEKDELLGKYEYRADYVSFGNGFGVEYNDRESYQDPLNHPIPVIKISLKCVHDIRHLTSVLLHELLHYYLWYIGWDYGDGEKDFENMCEKMELPSNFVYEYDYRKMDKYIRMYIQYRKNFIENLQKSENFDI